MVKVAIGFAFLLSCLLGWFLELALLFALEGNRFEASTLINGYTLYVICTTSLVAYSLSFLWAKVKHWYLTATITGIVAAFVLIPSIASSDLRTAVISVLYVLAEWFVLGTIAHFVCLGAKQLCVNLDVRDANYWS